MAANSVLGKQVQGDSAIMNAWITSLFANGLRLFLRIVVDKVLTKIPRILDVRDFLIERVYTFCYLRVETDFSIYTIALK